MTPTPHRIPVTNHVIEPRMVLRAGNPRTKAIFTFVLMLSIALSINLVGVPTTLSIGGGIALIIFGSLWPMLWIASMLPHRWFGFLHAQHAPDYATSSRPHITVIAPARNEEPVAQRLVSQFLDQDYDNWRLIVVANNCTDRTADVARAASGADPRITVLEATFPNGVKADALNYALDFVEGDVVLELDSDNQVPPDLLSKIAKAFSDPGVMAVQTQIRAYNGKDGLLAAFQDLEFLIYSEIWNRGRAALGLSSSIGGTGFAARVHVLRQLGGWTRDLVEDFEMHTRLVAHGIDVTYLPWAFVYDEKPITWGALIMQRKRWIRGHLEITARRAGTDEKLGWIDQFYLYSPVFVAISLSLFSMGYLSLFIPSIVRGYTYFSPWFWLVSLGIMIIAVTVTVARSRDYRLIPLILPYLLFFTFHWMVVFGASVAPVSWAKSKTVHGVQTEGGMLSYLGVDHPKSLRILGGVFAIAFLWMLPLYGGLKSAPSPIKAPMLQAGRSIAVAMAGAAEAQGISDGIVQGRVRDAHGKPVLGATVTMRSTSGVIWRATTNSSGEFFFPYVTAGTYTITIECRGFDTATTTFTVAAQGGVWIDATMTTRSGGIIVVPIPY